MTANPCDPLKGAQIPPECQAGNREFVARVGAAIEARKRSAVAWVSNDPQAGNIEARASQMAKDLRLLVKAKQGQCKNKNLQACGFVSGATVFEKVFGPLRVPNKPAPKPTTIPFTSSRSMQIVIGEGQSTTDEWLIDTGTTGIALAQSFITRNSTSFRAAGEGSYHNVGLTVSLGGLITFRPQEVHVVPTLDGFEGRDIDHRFIGIIGQSFLANHAYEIRFSENLLVLDQDTKRRISEDTSGNRWEAIPFKPIAIVGLIQIDVFIDGQAVPLIIDTGASYTYLRYACASRLVTPNPAGTSVTLKIGTRNIKIHDPVPRSDHPTEAAIENVQTCGLLGLDIMRHFNIIYDPFVGALFMQKWDRNFFEVRSVPIPRTCVVQRDKNTGRLYVVYSSAEQQGWRESTVLKADDQISAVDGVPYDKMTPFEHQEMIIMKKGPIKYEILRNGRRMVVEIP